MHSNKEMLDYRNECSQIKYFWCGNGALDGHLGWPTQTPVLVYASTVVT